MKKKEFKQELIDLLAQVVEGMSFSERMDLATAVLVNFQAEQENESNRDCSNKGKAWSDEELKIVLLDAPTRDNCLKYALLFKRGYGSIEQIYRWAATSEEELDERRKADSYIKQIHRVAKEVGWRV